MLDCFDAVPTVVTLLRLCVLSYALHRVVVFLLLVNKVTTLIRNAVNPRRLKTGSRRTGVSIDKGYDGVFYAQAYLGAFREVSSTLQKADEDIRAGNEFGYRCEVEKLFNHFVISRLSIPRAAP